MDNYRDLTCYQRYHYENARNIGFEKASAAVSDKKPDDAFFRRLAAYLRHPVNTSRGGAGFRKVSLDGTDFTLGFSEIRVLSSDGTVYASPDSMVSAILEGRYLPPPVYIDAVLNGPDPDGEVCRRYLERYTKDCFWGTPEDELAVIRRLADEAGSGSEDALREEFARDPRLLNVITPNGTLLNQAILSGREETAAYLIGQGIALDLFEGRELLTAVENGMENIAVSLLERGIEIKTDLPRNNPLFLAIAKNQNAIAERLYRLRKDLVVTYNTQYTENCNILQWTKMFRNDEFFRFLQNQYQSF